MAEADFRSAIETARSQGNKAWELRAATSLARLLIRRGHHRAALENLAPVYASFSEGFQTPDLREARSLLDEMAHLPAD
jgi:predicted ATPase